MKDVSCYIVIGVGCDGDIYVDETGWHSSKPFLYLTAEGANAAIKKALFNRHTTPLNDSYTVQKVDVKITPSKQWVKCTAEELRLHMREVTHIQDDLVGLAQMFVEQRVRFVTSYWEIFK